MGVNTKPILTATGQGRYIKVTPNNAVTVADWSKSEAVLDNQVLKDGKVKVLDRVRVKTRKGVRVAQIGDAVVKKIDVDGKTPYFEVIKADELAHYIGISV